jgi:oligopeptide transport system substrate-binding protein
VKSARFWDCEFGQQRPLQERVLGGFGVGDRRTSGWLSRMSPPRHRLILCLSIIAMLSCVSCTKQDEAEKAQEPPSQLARQAPTGGIYRRPLGNDPASLDPARINDYFAGTVATQIFDGLVEFDVHLNVLPALAQSWSASTDGLIWTFALRKGVKFHNDREVAATDVVYSLSRLLDPVVGARRTWFLHKVKGAEAFQANPTQGLDGLKAIDRYTVQITLSEPFAPFISMLGLPQLAVVPQEEVERPGQDFGATPIGTGPFRLARWERGQEIVLEANEHYFRGRPALDRVRFVIFPGAGLVNDDMIRAFERGDLEESPIPADRRKELLESKKYIVIRKPTLSLLLLGFNLERSPFDRQLVRQAFNYAIDKVRINREIRADRFVVARGILPPGMPGYNPEVEGYDYEPDKAKALLRQAGYPDAKNLPITWASSSKSAASRQDYEAVRQYLVNIGVELELREFDNWPTFQHALHRGDLEMFRYAWLADYPDPDNFLYLLFHSQSAYNYLRYRNPTVDRLLDDARREIDDLRRVGLYRQAEQLIMRDAPAIMLLHYTYEGLFQPYVSGIEVSALGDPYIPIRRIRIDQTRQARVKE